MNKTTIDTANHKLSIAKTLNAPIDAVWDIWTKPEHIANWWGPNGFTNTIHKMDLNANGEWNLTMHGPDGKNYANRSVFVKIEPFQQIVFQHFNPDYLATINFEPEGDQTAIAWTMEFPSGELFETVVKVFKADEGLFQNMEKLGTYLRSQL